MTESTNELQATGHYGRDRAFWGRWANYYDQLLAPLRGSVERAAELTAEGIAGADRVLEVGAGTGLMTERISPHVGEVVAIDYTEAMVTALRRRVDEADLANVRCAHGDVYDLDFAADRFDAVVAGNMLHLLPRMQEALDSVSRVLRPEGRLAAPTFCHDETWLSSVLSRVLAVLGEPMHRRLNLDKLRKAVERAGYEVGRTETVSGLIPIGYVEATLARA